MAYQSFARPLVTRGKSRNWRLALNYLTFAVSASMLGPLRCRDRVDAVLVYEPSPVTVGLPGIVMGAFRRAPVLLWIQDLWPETLEAVGVPAGGVPRVSPDSFRTGYIAIVICYSSIARLRSETRGARLRVSRIEYLPNWAEEISGRWTRRGRATPCSVSTVSGSYSPAI